jgi:hypothetical protein
MRLNRRQFLAATASFCVYPLSGGSAEEMNESRAILDEGLHWLGYSNAEKICRRVKEAGFNVLVPCIWDGRGTTWPSRLAPRDERLRGYIKGQGEQFDPVRILLDTAKKHDLEVHPWFSMGLRNRDDLFPELAVKGAKSFDWYKPAFRDRITEIVLEVIAKYPVDGVNLDYVRFSVPQGKRADEAERAISGVIGRIYKEGKRLKPNLVVSVDAAPWKDDIKTFGQNAPKWADEGIVDVVYSMQYHANPDFGIIKTIQSKMKRPEAMVVMVGNFDRVGPGNKVVDRRPDRLSELISKARALSKGNGVAVYLYGQLSERQIETLRKGVFRAKAKPSWRRARV